MDMRQIALNMISKNPQVANNPQAQQYINVIKNGSDQEIQNLAQNILNSYGISEEQARNDISKGFGIAI